MNRNKFMLIDLVIFSILAGIAEFLSTFMFKIFNSGFYMSFSTMIVIIVMVRWKFAGIVPAVVSGVVAFILNHYGVLTDSPMTIPNGLMYYVLANCFIVFSVLVFFKDWENALDKKTNFVIFVILSFVFVAIGKSIMIFIINRAVDGFLAYLGSSALTLVISLIFLILFKDKTDLVVNMDKYIRQVQEEE